MLRLFISFFLLWTCSTVAQIPEPSASLSFQTSGFTENRGQIRNTLGKTENSVLFKAEQAGIDIYITENGLSYVFKEIREENEREEAGGEDIPLVRLDRIDLTLAGANISRQEIYSEHQENVGFRNYYLEHCPEGVTGVTLFREVWIRNVYPGIDWRIYFNPQNQIKYDFVVHPGGDPKAIKLQFAGQKDLLVTDTSLSIFSVLGVLKETGLYVYQSVAIPIDANYSLKDNTVSYQIKNYDKTKDLIIDPLLKWSTYYGGSSFDGIMSVKTDEFGHIYCSGYTYSTDFPVQTLPGALNNPFIGPTDAFITKFNANGTLLWSTTFGGNGLEQARCLASLPGGDMITAGHTSSNGFPIQSLPGAYSNAVFGGYTDAFITRFDVNGALVWSTFFGDVDMDDINSIALDQNQNLYVAGYTFSMSFPVLALPGAFNASATGGGMEGFIARFDNTLALDWSTYFGGSFTESIQTICTDQNNNLYAAGMTNSPNFPVLAQAGSGYNNTSFNGTNECFIARFSPSGALTWSTFYGGSNEDQGLSAACDPSGNLYVSGSTRSSNFPVQSNSVAYYDPSLNGNVDCFVLKFNPAGVREWATYYGGSEDEMPYFMFAQDNGYVYMMGMTASNNFPIQFLPGSYNNNAFNNNSPGPVTHMDGFLARFDSTGMNDWTLYVGTEGNDWCTSLDSYAGCLYLVGEFVGAGGPMVNPGQNAYYQGYVDIDDSFIMQFCTEYITNDTIVACPGDTMVIHGVNIFTPGTYDSLFVSSDGYDSLSTVFFSHAPFYSTISYDTVCVGDSVFIAGIWRSTPGIYTDSLQTAIWGCDSMITTVLTIDTINALFSPSDTAACSPATVQFTNLSVASPGNIHSSLWLFGDGSQSVQTNPIHTYATSGVYNVGLIVADYTGCRDSVYLNQVVTVYPEPSASFWYDPLHPSETEPLVHFTNNSNDAVGWFWTFGDGGSSVAENPEHVYESPGAYLVSLTVISPDSCINTITYQLFVDPLLTFFCPNTFTPNGDGINDLFMAKGGGIEVFTLQVFDRWGELVFESDRLNQGWNGTYRGRAAKEDVYVWKVLLKSVSGHNQIYTGHVSLIR